MMAKRAKRTTAPPTAMPMIAPMDREGDPEEVDGRENIMGVGAFEGVLEGVPEMVGVIDGVEEPSHSSPELHTIVGLPHSTDPP